MNDFLRRGFNASLSGLDASIGNLASDPSAKNILGTARDVLIETLPGDQRTNLDVNYGEGTVKTGASLRDREFGITPAFIGNVQKRAGNLRETVAEKGLRPRTT